MMRPCVLCGREDVESDGMAGRVNVAWIQCPDCGWYALTLRAAEEIEKLPPDSPARLNLISYTLSVQTTPVGQMIPLLWKCEFQTIDQPVGLPTTIRNVEDFVSAPIQHSSKPDDVLRLLATKLSKRNPFDEVDLTLSEIRELKIANWSELAEWMQVLAAESLVEGSVIRDWTARGLGDDRPRGPMPPVQLTPVGWDRVEKLFGSVGSSTGFIAMAFEFLQRADVQKAIEDACRSNGWKAQTVAQQEFTGPIMDRVLSEIKRARFVVADFTEHKMGVYYEAGYAEGRHVPVIYTVREDQMKLAHFDTRHLNHIAWKTPEELQQRLEARIGAVIGKGPVGPIG